MSMNTYGNWYSFILWANESWKRGYTEREKAEYAYVYLREFRYSKEVNRNTAVIDDLLSSLFDDGSEEATQWFNLIVGELHHE